MSVVLASPLAQPARYAYKAFLSYSHAADGQLCALLQGGLQSFAKPWYRRRAIRVFRDTTGLAVTPDLWESIRAALESSEYFVLFASERAAQSHWVEMEVDTWLRIASAERLLIVQTDGEMVWDGPAGDFDWQRTTSLPVRLRGAFRAEPLYLDLRWVRTRGDLSPRRPEFLDALARLSATLRQLPLDDLVGEDVRQHRRTRALAGAAIAALVVLLIAATGASLVAFEQSNAAREQLVKLLVANGAREIDGNDLSASALWFAEALRVETGKTQERALQRIRLQSSIAQHPALRHAWFVSSDVVGRGVEFGRDERYLLSDGYKEEATGGQDRSVGPSIWDAQSGEALTLTLPVGAQRVLAVEATADGPRAVVVDAQGTVLLDARAGTVLKRFDQPAGTVGAAFNQDGRVIMTVADDHAVRLWDAATGRLLATLQHKSGLIAWSLTPDGKHFAAMTTGTAHIWTLDSESTVRSHVEIEHKDTGEQIDISSDGRRAVTVATRTARLWDLTADRPTLLGSWDGVNHAEFSADGKLLLMADDAGEATVWSVGPVEQKTAVKHNGIVLHAAFTRDGKRFATAGTDGVARLWDVRSGAALSPPLHHETTVTGVAFDAAQKRLATATAGGVVRVWNLDRRPTPLLHESVARAAFHRDGHHLLTVSDREVKLWNLEGGPPLTLTVGSQIYRAELSPDGGRIVTASEDGRARVWDSATGKELLSLRHARRVSDAAFRGDGAWVATASPGGVSIWDARTGDKLQDLPRPGAAERWQHVAFTPDGARLLTLGLGILSVWSLADQRKVDGFDFEEPTSASFSTDGTRLLVLHGRSNARVYDGARAAPIGPAVRHENYVMDRAVFGADAKTVVLVSGGYARVWNAHDGTPVTPPLRHADRTFVNFAAASIDGRFIATAASDGTVRLWHARTGQPLTPPLRHGSGLREITISPDGTRIVSSGGDGVRLWDIASGPASGDEVLALSARVLAARQLDATGGVTPLTPAAFREAWATFRRARLAGPGK